LTNCVLPRRDRRTAPGRRLAAGRVQSPGLRRSCQWDGAKWS
jgi:hypothetical protein